MKILYFFLFILFFYAIIFNSLEPIPHRLSQSQIQENLIKAENYIFNYDTTSNLIIGTSLSSRLNFKILNNVSDLTFSGLSIYDGLDVLLQSKNKPKNIFIEINFIFRKKDHLFSKDLFSFPNYNFKKKFKFLRNDRTPISLLGANISKLIFPEQKVKTKINKDIINGYTENMSSYYKIPNNTLMYFINLEKTIKLLQLNGSKIHLIEIPVSYNNSNYIYYNYIRKELKKRFKNVDYINTDLRIKWETTDGLHLSNKSANEFSELIRHHFIN